MSMLPGIDSDSALTQLLEQIADQVEGLKGDDRHAYEDLEFFSRYVIGYGDSERAANSRFLKNLYEDLQFSGKNMLVLGPRGSAKSTACTITYPAWMIGRNRILRFMLACASMEKQGQAFGRQLDSIWTRNERYIKIFGELKPPQPVKWDATEKIVLRKEPPGGMKDPTLSVVGLGTAVPSRRADQIIVDDIVTQDNAYSEVMRKNVIQFVTQTLSPILVPGGRTIIVGSSWHTTDLYQVMARMTGLQIPQSVLIDVRRLAEIAELGIARYGELKDE